MSTLQTPATPRPPKRRRDTHEYIEYEKYIDSQVARTRKNVKLVDIASAMVVLVVALLGFFLTAAVLEHWILPGGLGTVGRVVMFVILVAGLGHFAWHTLWPLLSRPINPEYAAVAIEREHPSLKNSLINFLLFRSEKGKMPPAVFDALEEQAAQRLAQSPVDGAVDRTPLVRWGYVLLGILILGVVYSLASPKSTFDTARRVLMPWSNIATPSRVRITHINPGNAQVIQGDSLKVAAHIEGLLQGEVVHLSFDTADRQHVEQLVPMNPIDELGNFGCTLPPGDSETGIQQGLTYRIIAGDGRSIDFRVTALRAPTIRVRSVHYDYPDYTGLDDVTIEGRGDIRAVEGTTVTIVAAANGPIESAHLDLDADGTRDNRMRVEGETARTNLDLVLPRQRQTPKSTSYQLHMQSPEGVANRNPPQHTLEILPDFKPEVEITEPAERSREVQLNETLVLRVTASDPDYLLSEVKLHFVKQSGDEVVVEPTLLNPSQPGADRLDGRWEFTASDYELKPGEVLEYWAEARDNCQPEANATITERKELVIVAPAEGEQNPNRQREQGDNKGQQQNQPGQEGQGEGESAPNQQGTGDKKEGKGENGQGGQDQQSQGSGGTEQSQEGAGGSQQQNSEGAQGKSGQQQEANGQGRNGQNQSDQQSGEGQPGERQGAGSQQQNPGAQGTGSEEGGQQQEGAGGANEQSQPSGQPRQGEQRPGEPGGGQGTDAQGSPDGEQRPNGGEGVPSAGERRPVANDGSQDADALQRMNDHLTQEERQQATRRNATPGEAGAEQARQGEQGQNTNPEGGQGSEQVPEGARPSEAQPSGDRAGNNSAQSGSSPERKPGEQAADPQAPAGGQEPRDQANGAGADTEGGAPQNEQTPTGQQPRDGSKSAGGKQEGRQGNSGAGDQQDPQGAPESQDDADPRQKRPDAGPADQSEDAEPPTPGHGKKESDSQGESGGDRPGGGEDGGGQEANREGTGSAGQNQAADEGAGQSQDQGPGDAGTEAGSSDEAGRETGQSGSKPGEGSRERQGQGSKPGGEQGADPQQGEQGAQGEQKPGNEQQGAEQQARQQPGEGERGEQPGERGEQQGQEGAKPGEAGEQSQPGDNRQQKPQNDSRSATEAGGQPGNTKPGENAQSSGDNSPNNQKYDLQEADKANLEYARKQTDLVLDTLDKQLKENKVDQELLDKLGWSEQDLRKFVDRWQSLRQKANQDTPEGQAAKVELDERLRKLGPKRGTVGGETRRTEDTLRDLGEGYRSEVPLKYRDRVKRYTEGISK